MRAFRGYVVDEVPLVREGLSSWLRLAGLDVTGSARDAVTALRDVVAYDVELVVLGPNVSAADDLCRLGAASTPAPRCLVVAPAGRAEGVYGSLLTRSSYVFSDVEFAVFRNAVAGARDGLPAAVPAESVHDAEVLRLVADGLSNREIAAEMGMSVSWVKAGVSRLLTRASARSRTELVARALRDGSVGTTTGAGEPIGGPHGDTKGIAG
jgi:DNA-binding NarL/FixJ family response regulator